MTARGRSRSGPREAELILHGEREGEVVTLEALRLLHGYDAARQRERYVPRKGVTIPNGTLCDFRLSDEDFCDDTKFLLPQKEGYRDSLAAVNPTPRDARCVFVEATHQYFVDGVKAPWSGTAFSHYCERHFQADRILAETRPGWAAKKGYVKQDGSEMSAEEIKAQWEANGKCQSRRGTLLHWQIECYLNGYDIAEPHSPEFAMMLQFEHVFMDALGLTPWRVEMNLFHCGLRLAGQADLICKDHAGKFVILDWKRSREIKERAYRNEMQRAPLEHLPNTNRHCYNLQLNNYRHMLETEYGFEVSGMYLVVLHPNQRPAVPHVYKVPRMQREIEALVRQVVIDKRVSAENFPGAASGFDLAGTTFEL